MKKVGKEPQRQPEECTWSSFSESVSSIMDAEAEKVAADKVCPKEEEAQSMLRKRTSNNKTAALEDVNQKWHGIMRRRDFQWLIVLLIVLTRTRFDLQSEMSLTHDKLRELGHAANGWSKQLPNLQGTQQQWVLMQQQERSSKTKDLQVKALNREVHGLQFAVTKVRTMTNKAELESFELGKDLGTAREILYTWKKDVEEVAALREAWKAKDAIMEKCKIRQIDNEEAQQ